jgi:5'-deoxynucleotidase YfbR-like HD superfamily hydrolase
MTQIDTFGCLANTIKVAAGHYVDLADPQPETIDIVSIATALGRICRFGGHSPEFYSVAEHCVHAYELARADGLPTEALKAILLHDAAEAYIGDVVKPLKALSPWYMEIESRFERAIETRFDVDFAKHADHVRCYDRLMLKAEKLNMWPDDLRLWHGFDTIKTESVDFRHYGPRDASKEFYLRCLGVGIEVEI